MDPYRGGEVKPIKCPRCKKRELTSLGVGQCTCGRWVSAFVADIVLTSRDRMHSHMTWWRVREPCPQCGVKMALFGHDPGLLQGCEDHGYWIDEDTVALTGAGKFDDGAVRARLEDATAVEGFQAAEQERVEAKRRSAPAPKRPDVPSVIVALPPEEPPLTPAQLREVVRALARRIEVLESENVVLKQRLDRLEKS